MKQNVSHLGEFGLIRRIQKQVDGSKNVIVGIGDDAAVVRATGNKYILLTTDMLVDGVHFDASMSLMSVGRKALACSVSDIAAMGGRPLYALVSLGVPKNFPAAGITKIYQGMSRLARQFHVDIVGGDTVRHSVLTINVALVGDVQQGKFVRRSTARPGDVICVTGPLGNSFRSGQHLRFTPKIDEARYLVKTVQPTAMMDVTDGLSSDLDHIVKQSNAGALLFTDRIPKRKGATLEQALHEGEDFELLFTLPARRLKKLQQRAVVRVYPIGEITKGPKHIVAQDAQGRARRLTVKGYVHF